MRLLNKFTSTKTTEIFRRPVLNCVVMTHHTSPPGHLRRSRISQDLSKTVSQLSQVFQVIPGVPSPSGCTSLSVCTILLTSESKNAYRNNTSLVVSAGSVVPAVMVRSSSGGSNHRSTIRSDDLLVQCSLLFFSCSVCCCC